MSERLGYFFQDKCVVEGVDSVMMHEIVLGGHLYLQLLKEKLEVFLQVIVIEIDLLIHNFRLYVKLHFASTYFSFV